jgi:glyoxylase-like metal-dependent hydrolase (beta-lactamase superfamily II)
MSGHAAYKVIDLQHLGRPESILSCLVSTERGGYLVDPGPASCLEALRAGLTAHGTAIEELAGLLLTHIHLDHAGAAGTLARLNPGLTVHVHRAGAGHLTDPSKLLASATRLYGSEMERLWGEVAPVPQERVVALEGGEQLDLGGRQLDVLYTPGHAVHHVTYLDAGTGIAFLGDTAGLRTHRLPCVLPVTPPPDFDLAQWLASLDRIAERRPTELVITHFGGWHDVEEHLQALREGLVQWAEFARETLDGDTDPAAKVRAFVQRLEGWIEGKAPAQAAARFLAGEGPAACWHGLARYWRRRGLQDAKRGDGANGPGPLA